MGYMAFAKQCIRTGGPEMEASIAQIGSVVNGIVAFVQGKAQEMEIAEVERRLLSMVMEIGRASLEEYVAVKGTGYSGPELADDQGAIYSFVRDRSRSYRSIFGPVSIRRAYYHRPGSAGKFPLDGELNLPERSYSYVVQEFSSRLAVNTSYEDAVEILSSFFPVKMPLRSLERVVADVANEVEPYYDQKAPPKVCPESVVTVATVDKKGIVIRKTHNDESESQAKSTTPDKPGKKKMATVISAYTSPRHIRTAESIVHEMSDQKGSDSKPKPRDKEIWGSLTDGPEKTVARLNKAVAQRLPERNELVCILDGERSLWNLVHTYFPTAFFVLDIFHVLEHLTKAAQCFHDSGTPEARKFVTERLRILLIGRAGHLIGGLKQMLTKHTLSTSKSYDLKQVIGYLERNRPHMRYEICLAKGYPIGSGVIEGACRNLINDRLELTGMSWSIGGAESMMRLRAVHINKDWDAFWKYRRRAERSRIHSTVDSTSTEIRDQELQRAA
jgi:hypothetical protein